jgi:hypothetical protein
MAYTSQPTNSQSLTGIIEITDGTLTISDGVISNAKEIDCETIKTNGITAFSNNISKLNSTNTNSSKIKVSKIVSNVAYIKNLIANFFNIGQPQTISNSHDIVNKKGDMRYDTNYLYIKVTETQWKRIPLENF